MRMQVKPPRERSLGNLTDVKRKKRVNCVVDPGVLLSSKGLAGGCADPYNPHSKLYLLCIPGGCGYIYFNTDKRHPGYMKIEFADGRAHAISSYAFKPHHGRFPITWKLEASNDGVNWDLVHNRKSKWFKKGARFSHSIKDPKPYKMYRFVFPAYSNTFMVAWYGLSLTEVLPDE
jgi:hypothetical protein